MTVICLEEPGALADTLNVSGIDVIALRRQQGFRPSLARTIAELTRAHDIDLLHCQQYSLTSTARSRGFSALRCA